MARLNANGIKKAKILCFHRDGLRCNKKLGHGCGRKPPAVYLELDHVDGNEENNPCDASNWQLLCRTCNRKKDARGEGRIKSWRKFRRRKSGVARHVARHGASPFTSTIGDCMRNLKKKIISLREGGRERKRRDEEQLRKQYVSVDKNLVAEPIVRSFVQGLLRHLKVIFEEDLLNAAAEEVTKATGRTISQQAVARYIDKICNPINGDYDWFRDANEEWCVKVKELSASAAQEIINSRARSAAGSAETATEQNDQS